MPGNHTTSDPTDEIICPASGIAPFKAVKVPLWKRDKNPKYKVYRSPFGHPYGEDFLSRNQAILNYPTLKTKQILALSQTIRKKPQWWIKYKNPDIVAKWEKEAVGQADIQVSKVIFDYVIAELAWYEQTLDSTQRKFQQDYSDFVFYGDSVIPETLKTSFVRAAKDLETAEETNKDWHPGSDQRVWDLVHPSLYPLQYNITPVVEDMATDHVGLGINYKGPSKPMRKYNHDTDLFKADIPPFAISEKFQWLPSIFNVARDGKVTIESYINNLHPIHHKDLYQPIADIFSEFVPAINATLTRYASPQYLRDDPSLLEHGIYGPEPKFDPDDPDRADKIEDYYENRVPIILDPVFKMPEEKPIDVHGTRLKVIVKMASIELTPERPNYDGGTWHVEGASNEDIVCTCIYYYSVENITEDSSLRFRAAVTDPIYEQSDDIATEMIYGLHDGDLALFSQGAVDTVQDRLLVFPNMLQHCVTPFTLKDKTKPGHRKILCFFVCDPYNDNIVSTDSVPPQQSAWWVDEILNRSNENKTGESTYFDVLPKEVLSMIFAKVEWPMPLERAKEVREKLMEERKILTDDDDRSENVTELYKREFSLCEH